MNIKVKTIAVPAFIAISLIFGACADNTIEAPDAIDGAVQEGVEGIEQGAEDAGNAVQGGLENLQKGAEGAVDGATDTIQDGAKNLQKGAGDVTNSVKDGIDQGLENAGDAVENLGKEAE